MAGRGQPWQGLGLANGMTMDATGSAATTKPSYAPGISQASNADTMQPGSQSKDRDVLKGAVRPPAPWGWRAGTTAPATSQPQCSRQGVLVETKAALPAPGCLRVVKTLWPPTLRVPHV